MKWKDLAGSKEVRAFLDSDEFHKLADYQQNELLYGRDATQHGIGYCRGFIAAMRAVRGLASTGVTGKLSNTEVQGSTDFERATLLRKRRFNG